METIIIYSDGDLIAMLKSSLDHEKGWTVSEKDGLVIHDSHNKYSKLELPKPEDLYEDNSTPKLDLNNLKIYALHYSSLEGVKFLLKKLPSKNTWINNDFQEINYSHNDFIGKLEAEKDWDWRSGD